MSNQGGKIEGRQAGTSSLRLTRNALRLTRGGGGLRNQATGGKATIICAAIYALEQGKLLRNRIVITEALGRLFIVVDGKTGTGSSVAGRYKAGRV